MNDNLIDVAMGHQPADLIIRGGKLVNVISREVYEADLAIKDGLIASIESVPEGACGENTKIVDATGYYLAPGFIDAHIHFESSMLSLTEFCKATLKRGTTSVATDLMEVTIVAGMDGVNEVFREAEGIPLKLFQTVPAFMSEEDELQTIGSTLNPSMIEQMLKRPNAVGLAEVLYPPVLAKDDGIRHILDLANQMGKTAEGHAPALLGGQLDAYTSAGIRSDHESTSREEALAKLRRGLRVLMREGSAATDLAACLEMITKDKIDTRYCSMVSDDIDALHIYRKGHLDHKVRMAVEAGVDPVTAIQMVTINPAEGLKIDGLTGSITPGKAADIVLLRSLEKCDVAKVFVDGELFYDEGEIVHEMAAYHYPESMLHTVQLKKAIEGTDLGIRVEDGSDHVNTITIGVSGVTLLTDKLEYKLPVEDGFIQADVDRDVLHIACVERYGKSGGIGKAFVNGFNLKSCSMATSVGHDHHNITAVGSNLDDMALAINTVAETGGGIAIVRDGQVLDRIALQIFGLFSTDPAEEVAKTLERMLVHLHEDGCSMSSPFMTLAFVTLIYIPELAITDKGLVEVIPFKVISPLS